MRRGENTAYRQERKGKPRHIKKKKGGLGGEASLALLIRDKETLTHDEIGASEGGSFSPARGAGTMKTRECAGKKK